MVVAVVLIILSSFRYRADYHFNEAMKMRKFGYIDEHIAEGEKAVRLNPFVLNYVNTLAMTYHQTAIKAVQAVNRKEASKWLAKSIYTAEKVQEMYPGEYYSARMLMEDYMLMSTIQISKRDFLPEIEKYHNIVISARPFKERVK